MFLANRAIGLFRRLYASTIRAGVQEAMNEVRTHFIEAESPEDLDQRLLTMEGDAELDTDWVETEVPELEFSDTPGNGRSNGRATAKSNGRRKAKARAK